MITLKKQYLVGASLRITAVALVAASELPKGKYKLSPARKERIHKIATTLAVAGAAVHATSHCRLLARGILYAFGKKVGK